MFRRRAQLNIYIEQADLDTLMRTAARCNLSVAALARQLIHAGLATKCCITAAMEGKSTCD